MAHARALSGKSGHSWIRPGSRWVSSSPGPRYFVVYEVRDIDILSSAPYLERLNNPTPWTSRMMPHYRGMVRGFCRLESSAGTVLGTTGVTVRYSAPQGAEDRLDAWLRSELIPDLVRRKGIASAFMLRSDRAPEMTAEQRIRGRDANVDRVLLVTGYVPDVMTGLAQNELCAETFASPRRVARSQVEYLPTRLLGGLRPREPPERQVPAGVGRIPRGDLISQYPLARMVGRFA